MLNRRNVVDLGGLKAIPAFIDYDPSRASDILPVGFPRYVRVFHSIYEVPGQEEPLGVLPRRLRIPDLAARFQVHPTSLTLPDIRRRLSASSILSFEGNLDDYTLHCLLSHLQPGPAGTCWFSFFPMTPEPLLVTGDVTDMYILRDTEFIPRVTSWWDEDLAWVVRTPADGNATYVGCSEDVGDALLQDERIDALLLAY
jgi:hypothetical protein